MISQNVIDETYTALENHKDLFDAADELGISKQGLEYRIKSYPKLLALAVSRGLYEMKKPAHALPDPPAIPKHPEPEPKAVATKAPAKEEPTPAKTGKNKPGFHRMDIQVPDDVYTDLVKMAELDMRPVNIQAVWLLKRVLAPICAARED